MKTRVLIIIFLSALIVTPVFFSTQHFFVKADTPTSYPLRILIVKFAGTSPYPSLNIWYWLNQMYKIPCDLVNETQITNNTIYDGANLKYCAVIWTSPYYFPYDGLAMANWTGVLPQLLTYVLGTTPNAVLSDSLFGAHYFNDVTIPANASSQFFPSEMTRDCQNYTGQNKSWGRPVSNLTITDGNLFWKVNDNIFLGAMKGKNVILPVLCEELESPDTVSREAPYTFTMLFNFLKLTVGYMPIMIPSQVLANIRVDDTLGTMPMSSSVPYPLTYINQFISDISANNAIASMGYVIANQTLTPGDTGKILLNQTGVSAIDNWVKKVNAMIKGNLTQNGGRLEIFAHGYTHVVCNETVYINAPDKTNSSYMSEWYDVKNDRSISYDVQYAQMSKIYPILKQWFNLTQMPLFIPSQGYFDENTIKVAGSLGYPYFGGYYNTYKGSCISYMMLGDLIGYPDGCSGLRAGGLESGIQPDASFANITYPLFAKYGIPIVPYLHAGYDFLGWNSSLQIINNLGAKWTNLEDIADVYAKQVTLPTMDLRLYTNGLIIGSFYSDDTPRKLFIDVADETYKISEAQIERNIYSATKLFAKNTIDIAPSLSVGNVPLSQSIQISLSNIPAQMPSPSPNDISRPQITPSQTEMSPTPTPTPPESTSIHHSTPEVTTHEKTGNLLTENSVLIIATATIVILAVSFAFFRKKSSIMKNKKNKN